LALKKWQSDAEIASTFIEVCINFMSKSLQLQPGIGWVLDALNSGLLQSIAQYGGRGVDRVDDLCTEILSEILQGFLCYYSVLRRTAKSLERIRLKGLDRRRIESSIWDVWAEFLDLAEERLGSIFSKQMPTYLNSYI
jgi:hypothetical protein